MNRQHRDQRRLQRAAASAPRLRTPVEATAIVRDLDAVATRMSMRALAEAGIGEH